MLVLLLSGGAAIGAPIDTSERPPASSSASSHWRVLDALPSRGEVLAALATSKQGGVAVGDVGGVSWWRGGSWSRAQTPAVRDLAFDGDGRLWIGTQEGLFVWAPEARPQRRTLRDGDASGRVSRIEAKGGVLVVATEAGAYWSSAGGTWQTLNAGSADQPVHWLALRLSGSGGVGVSEPGAAPELAEVWSYGAEGLVRTRGIEASAGLRVVDRIVWPLPRPLAEAGAVDLVLDRDASRLALVYADAIAALELAGGDPRTARWRWIRPVLPPGASIRRLVFGADATVWLATDHGLHTAPALDAPFARAANPAGSRECTDLAEGIALPGDARAIALCRTTLLALLAAVPGSHHAFTPEGDAAPDVGPTPAPIELPADPPVASIRDRALARVGLAVERADSLWRGLRARALLPSLQLRGAWDDDRDRGRSQNQTFVSGDTRNLFDRDRDEGRHYGAAVVLDWELGGLAYPDDSVDLYRELRQVTSLRDDVADEIHQLYFERQRIRARLARPEALAPGEAVELRLRAEELDAGLDAWTGGWIRAWRATRAAANPPIHPGRFEASND
ncbi:MAG: hypothetical protein IPK00_16715 [Deltaproteobacteria bacterium]|nr:hypothetical protein [Deltaproteobacteria bacterium]